MKVVINRCYGGFGLSHEAVMRYFEIKGVTVYPEQDKSLGHWKFWTYWLVKPEDRIESKEGEAFYAMSMEDRRAYNQAHSEQTAYPREMERHDPVLVQVVEEMGDKANGAHVKLAVVEIPDDVLLIVILEHLLYTFLLEDCSCG